MTTTIHLVFKTHLDIGFTDLAETVRTLYHERFIPQAIENGERLAGDPDHPVFIWTTGAWLIWDHLRTQSPERVRRLERAIEAGTVTWHALPFTTHSELMSPDLFRAGLSYAAELDARFGRRTMAAKMTDVPGHTIGIVPLLAEAGVRFLHLGVNAASPVPDVPPVFRWRAPGGEEVVVMYEDDYGKTSFPAGTEIGLSFAHSGDNLGPPGLSHVVHARRQLQAQHPGADVVASTLDRFGTALWEKRELFPVIEAEIGDSWIHGVASDPGKVKRYLAAQRLYDTLAREAATPARLDFGRRLALVAEHTWGADHKTYLRDETAWDRKDFEAHRRGDPRFAFMEDSWAEQRAYIDEALAMLDEGDRQRLDPPSQTVEGWSVETDPATGDIAALVRPDGMRIAGRGGSLLGFRYESYDAGDVAAHFASYVATLPLWAQLDFGKPGLERASSARSASFAPRVAEGELRLPDAAHALLGAPATVRYEVRGLDARRAEITVTLMDKPANRMPEASFVTFTPETASGWDLLKMGVWHRAGTEAERGGGQLQAIEAARNGGIAVRPLDTPLAGPADAPFMPYNPGRPDYSAGLRFNLHNNKWGTNFQAWWGGDFSCRFVIET